MYITRFVESRLDEDFPLLAKVTAKDDRAPSAPATSCVSPGCG